MMIEPFERCTVGEPVSDYALAFAEELEAIANLLRKRLSPADLGHRVERLGRMMAHRV